MQREEDALNDTDQKPRRLKQREPGREPNETCLISTEGWTRRVHFVREGGGLWPFGMTALCAARSYQL